MSFKIINGDIAQVNTEAVVLPANEALLEGPGCSEAIFIAAGERELTAACTAIGFCAMGKAVITPGFNLKAKHIIHAVCPPYVDGRHKERELLYSAYQSSLKLATENKIKSLSFPLLSSGSYRYPRGEALDIAKTAIRDYLDDCEDELLVQLVIYDKRVLRSESEFIHQIDILMRRAYLYDARRETMLESVEYSYEVAAPKKMSLDDLIKQEQKTFVDLLMEYIIRSELKNSQIYHRANITKQVFSKTISGQSTPKKETILALAIALQLSIIETEELLMKAGYALSDANLQDVIVRFYIERGHYDLYDINYSLYDNNLPVLGY